MHIQLKMTTQITLENLFLGTGAGEIDGGGSMLFLLEMMLSSTSQIIIPIRILVGFLNSFQTAIINCQCDCH